MRETGKILKCALASLGLGMRMYSMAADSSPVQYKSITHGNVFRLKAVERELPVEPPRPALPKIILKGITTVCNKLAIMTVLFPAKAGEPAREQSYMLAEGQRDGDMEVLQVDDKGGTVKLNYFGTMMTITFDKGSARIFTPGLSSPSARQ